MPLELFHRCTGPEENMKYRIDKDWWPIHVAALEDLIKKDPDMPPLIVHYVEDDFELNEETPASKPIQILELRK